jgi:hypothetical protein
MRKGAPYQRVEEGLRDLEIVVAQDLVGVGDLQFVPELAFVETVAQFFPKRLDALVDAAAVQIQPLDGIATDAPPGPLFEALLGATGDGTKALVVVVEGATNEVGADRDVTIGLDLSAVRLSLFCQTSASSNCSFSVEPWRADSSSLCVIS